MMRIKKPQDIAALTVVVAACILTGILVGWFIDGHMTAYIADQIEADHAD